ncbi:dTDP-4-dehydrorhamnose reductase [Capnocytophaga sp. ARDL2]|uniref:dTDP-4-dehydrorhamnose reductase n=1 Tax=Capnocytophaga sp. ARDL2 TaxID=3238809 RepID=UPI0035568B25
MRVLVTGKNGQLGSELFELTNNDTNTYEYVFVDREKMDLSDTQSILKVLQSVQPQLIINAGAYTAVDKAESESELADAINHQAIKAIGEWSKQNKAKVIHISTDYVFDAKDDTPIKENHEVFPINVYGKTKQLGEKALEQSGAEFVIIRTAWVYSTYGTNFVKTMIKLMEERDELSIINDQVGSPTYARDLAQVILKIVEGEFHSGYYHYSNEGKISWFEFAEEIKRIKGLECRLTPIATEQYPTPACRPKFSLLDKTKIKETYKIEIPFWKDSLKEMMRKL